MYFVIMLLLNVYQLITFYGNIFIQVTEVVFILSLGSGECPRLAPGSCQLRHSVCNKTTLTATISFLLTYEGLSGLEEKVPVYFVVFQVLMIIDITGSMVAVLHPSPVGS